MSNIPAHARPPSLRKSPPPVTDNAPGRKLRRPRQDRIATRRTIRKMWAGASFSLGSLENLSAMAHSYRIVKTPLGYVGFIATERGLRRVYLPEKTVAAARTAIRRQAPDSIENSALLPELAAAL